MVQVESEQATGSLPSGGSLRIPEGSDMSAENVMSLPCITGSGESPMFVMDGPDVSVALTTMLTGMPFVGCQALRYPK